MGPGGEPQSPRRTAAAARRPERRRRCARRGARAAPSLRRPGEPGQRAGADRDGGTRAGRLHRATGHLTEALALAEDCGNSYAIAMALRGLAAVRRDQGRHAEAERHARAALQMAQRSGSKRGDGRGAHRAGDRSRADRPARGRDRPVRAGDRPGAGHHGPVRHGERPGRSGAGASAARPYRRRAALHPSGARPRRPLRLSGRRRSRPDRLGGLRADRRSAGTGRRPGPPRGRQPPRHRAPLRCGSGVVGVEPHGKPPDDLP
ncbi:tetratricopeptide repeat protein [Plantactinospora sp. GCM10030261]|uniref:tetratricopeptide repeat protein n=1 Tax=Plantactinospora sp. GCM10030261 TaxID=3273420 RepID=UPI0036105692